MEIDGPRSAAFFFAEVTVGDEKRLYEVARRLTEMGLKERRPSPR